MRLADAGLLASDLEPQRSLAMSAAPDNGRRSARRFWIALRLRRATPGQGFFLRADTATDIIKGLPEATRQGMLDGTPLGRFASTWDIANAILFLSSAESDFITGQQIVVDGGFSLKAG